MMRFAFRAVRSVESPPKPQAYGPKEIEILRRISTVGIGTELGVCAWINARFDKKEQFAGAFQPLNDAFQPEQATRLKDLSEKRRIPRANIVRFAVERLLDDINGGQMDLPLGLNNV